MREQANEDCAGIELTLPARLVNGALVIYYKQASHPVPFGTLLVWNGEEQKESSVTDDKRIIQHPENRIIPDQLFNLDESRQSYPRWPTVHGSRSW